MTMAGTRNITFWHGVTEPIFPTARITIPSSGNSICSDGNGDDYLQEERNGSELKATSPITATSQPSPRRGSSNRKSSSHKNRPSLPAYTNANPLLNQVNGHSFTHSGPTHKLVSCARCRREHDGGHESSTIEEDNLHFHLHAPFSLSRDIHVRRHKHSSSSSSSFSSSSSSSSSWSSLLGCQEELSYL